MEFVSYGRATAASRPARDADRAPGRTSSRVDSSRVAWVDVAKGICIILVVMMHATLGVGDAMGREGFMHWVVAFARPFRMPDFFLISGLFLGRVIDRDWRSYADKRVVHFAYFYLLWLVIQSAFKFGQLSGGTPLGFLEHLARALVEPFSTLWFIYMLAIFSIVTKLLRGVPTVVVLAAATALEVLPINTGFFLVDQFCARWVYFLVGFMFAERIFAFAATVRDRPRAAALGLVVWALANTFLALTPSPLGAFATLAELPVVGLGLGIAGALAIVALAALVSGSRVAEPLRRCGGHSIAIYLAFFLPMALTRQILVGTGIVPDVGVVSLLTTATAVLVPLLLERAVRRTPLSFLFRRPERFRLRSGSPRAALQAAE